MNIKDASEAIATDRLDAEVLLAAILKKDRTWLLAHPKQEMTEEQVKQWEDWRARRMKNEPVAYITGEKRFYGRPFKVDQRVLIPRPSTEGLIDLALEFLKTGKEDVREVDRDIVAVAKVLGDVSEAKTVVDVGVGSGCVAITLALERHDLQLIATDISAGALEVARENAELHGVSDRIDFREGNLLEPVANLTEPFLLVSNPPYIPEGEELMPDVADYEPHEALLAGKDGTAVIRPLIENARKHPNCRGIAVECRQEHIDLFDLDR